MWAAAKLRVVDCIEGPPPLPRIIPKFNILRSTSATCLKHLLSTPSPPKQMLTSFSKPPPGSQPWTMEYVARLFLDGGGFQGIADTHNAALKRAKAETQAASDLVLNSHGGIRPRKPESMHVPIHSADIAA